MEYPHAAKYDTPHRYLVHHNKTDTHKNRHSDHNANFGLPCHAFALDIALQIILVKLGISKPGMQFLRTFAKAEGCQKQKGKGWKQRQHSAQSAQPHTNAAQGNVHNLFDLHVVFSNRLFSF